MHRSRLMVRISQLFIVVLACSQGFAASDARPRPGGEYDGVLLTGRESSSGPIRLLIRETATSHPVHREVLGFNWGWVWTATRVLEIDTTRLTEAFTESIRNLPVPLIRMAGTESQYFQWREAIGPLDARRPIIINAYDKSFGKRRMDFGLPELVRVMQHAGGPTRLAYVLNFELDSAQDHADLAEYLTGDGRENLNGGKNWAAVRIASGLPEPVDVAVWELGNELDWSFHRESFPSVEVYIERCRETIRAIRAVQPDARFAALTTTAPWNKKMQDPEKYWPRWHRRVIEELGDEIDYLTFHPYYHGHSPVTLRSYMDRIAEDVERITGSDRIKFFISEHARWPGPRPGGGLRGRDTHNLKGCLAVAEFLNLSFGNPDVAMMAYHNLNAGPWNAIELDSDTGRWHHNGIARLFQMYHRHLGTHVVTHRIRGDGTSTEKTDLNVTVLVTSDQPTRGDAPEELSVILVNRDSDDPRRLSISASSRYRIASGEIMTSGSMDAANTATESPLDPRVLVPERHGDLRSFVLPAKSIVAMKLVRVDDE
ncbi:hypothetical protein [Mucisphaera calidilacus]|nr:hypothetical protein [Mucisphaera calidilacus]